MDKSKEQQKRKTARRKRPTTDIKIVKSTDGLPQGEGPGIPEGEGPGIPKKEVVIWKPITRADRVYAATGKGKVPEGHPIEKQLEEEGIPHKGVFHEVMLRVNLAP